MMVLKDAGDSQGHSVASVFLLHPENDPAYQDNNNIWEKDLDKEIADTALE